MLVGSPPLRLGCGDGDGDGDGDAVVSAFATAVSVDVDVASDSWTDSIVVVVVVVDSVLATTMDSSISCTAFDTGIGLEGSDLVHRRLCMSLTLTLFLGSRGFRGGSTTGGATTGGSTTRASSPSPRVVFAPPRSTTASAAARRHALSTLLALSIKYFCIVPRRVDLVDLVTVFHPRNDRPANAVARVAAARSNSIFLLFL